MMKEMTMMMTTTTTKLCTQLGTVHTPCPSRGYSYSIGERRGRCSGIIIIRMGPIGRYIIHCTWHTILIATQHHHYLEWLLHCHSCTNSSIPTRHRHITQSTASPN